MAALAQASGPATNHQVPIIIDGTRANPGAIALARAWLKLLNLERRTFWAAPRDDGNARTIRPRRGALALRPDQAAEAHWRNAAQCLIGNGTFRLKTKYLKPQRLYAFALPPTSSRGFCREVGALLKNVAMHHNAPLLELDQLSLYEKLHTLSSFRWIIGPSFDDLELVHALKQRKGASTTLILLSRGKRRSRTLLKTLHCMAPAAHRLMELPEDSPDAALHDLVGWITHQGGNQ